MSLVHTRQQQIVPLQSQKIKRSSELKAPIMLLTGHTSPVLSCSFNSDGTSLASSGMDKDILLWNTRGDCENYGILSGHKAAVLQVLWSREGLVSCSADHSLALWDTETGDRIKRFKTGSIVNSCARNIRGQQLVASVENDGKLLIWDARDKNFVKSFSHPFPLTSCEFSIDGSFVYFGGLDNNIMCFDLKNDSIAFTLSSHYDSITGLELSSRGDLLLSNSMDNTVKVWDVKPFVVGGERLKSSLEGAPQGFEKNLIRPCWSPDGDFIACGSADRSVVVWSLRKEKIVYKLPGHKGCVNQVAWNKTLLASCSTDKTLFLGELNVSEVK